MIIARNEKSKKFLKNSLIVILAICVIFLLLIILLKYEVEGEDISKMPFQVEKILIGSTADGIRLDSTEEYRWNINLLQVNDIYIGIQKNPDVNKTEMIKSITIDSIQINKRPQVGTPYFTKITQKENGLREYEGESITQISYDGVTNVEDELNQIPNQGGYIGFRYIINDIKEYKSNEEEIRYNGELLDNAGITLKQIESEISFDIIIELESNVKYKTSVTLKLPIGDILQTGTETQEITDLNLIFKRI